MLGIHNPSRPFENGERFSMIRWIRYALIAAVLAVPAESTLGDTTFEVRVSASTDDATQDAAGGMSLTDAEMKFEYHTWMGLRFNNVTIPKNATITAAYITFRASASASTATTPTIYGQDASSAATFTTSSNNISSRAKTSATVNWSMPSWTAGQNYNSPSITTVVQQIVSRSDWSSGNSLAILINTPTSGADRMTLSYNGNTSLAPLLHITYTTNAHWKLDEASGTSAADASGCGHTGTVTGTASWSSAVRNNGFSFNGSTKIQAPGLMDTPRNVTLAAWAKLTAADTYGATIVSLGDYFAICLDDPTEGGTIAFFYNGTTWVVLRCNQSHAGMGWHHFAAVFDDDNNSLKLYIDGAVAASTSTTASISYTGLGSNTVIGRHGNTGTSMDFTGVIDDVHAYGYALTAAQIVELYGLVGHWKLNETSGTSAADSSGIANNGTVHGTATWTSAVHGNGFSADYTNGEDYIEIANSSSLQDVQENSYSLAAWFKPTNLPPGTGSANNAAYRIVGKAGSHLGLAYDYAGEFYVEHFLGTTPTWYGAGAWYASSPGKWYHVAGVIDRDAGTIKLYLNGSLAETTTFTAGSAAYEYGTVPWRIGISYPAATNWGHAARGVIDDVRIYNRAIMADEVAKLAGFVGHWKMNEGSGTTAADSTALANNATLSGGASWTTDCAGNNNALLTNGTGGIAATGSKFAPGDEGTIAFWMRSSGAPASTVAVMGLADTWEVRQAATGKLYFDIGADAASDFMTNTALSTANQWYHVAVTYDNSNKAYAVYVDGQLDKSGTNTNAMTVPASAVLSFGKRTGATAYWSGALRDVRVYNRKLFSYEIAQLYGLLGRWKLVESSGSTATDQTLLANSGTYTNGVSLATSASVPGYGAVAAKFDGVDDYVDVANESDFDITGPITVAAWIRADSFTGTHREFVSKGGFAWRLRYRPDISQASFKCTGLTTDEVLSSGSLLPRRWYHMAGVYTGSALQLYINGVLNNSVSTSGSISTNNYVVNIGRNAEQTGREFNGAIYDARVYNRALCPTEISQLYGSAFTGVKIIKWEEIQ